MRDRDWEGWGRGRQTIQGVKFCSLTAKLDSAYGFIHVWPSSRFFFLFLTRLFFKLESSRLTTYTNIKMKQPAPLQKNLSIICGKLTWNNTIPATIKVETNWVENLKSEKRKQNYDWKPKKILSGTSISNNCTNFEPAYLSPCRNSKLLHQCRAKRTFIQ